MGRYAMNIAEHAVIRPHLIIQPRQHWITASYVAFALIILAAAYLDSFGPGFTAAELARAAALP